MLLQRVSQQQQERAVELHRAADIQQDHQLWAANLLASIAQIHRIAASADAAPYRASEVEPPGDCDLQSPRQTKAHLIQEAQCYTFKLGDIRRRNLGKVRFPQPLSRTGA